MFVSLSKEAHPYESIYVVFRNIVTSITVMASLSATVNHTNVLAQYDWSTVC